jgi:hypothetical protein
MIPRTGGLVKLRCTHVRTKGPQDEAVEIGPLPAARASGLAVFHRFTDHLVSQALYLADPDGNGLELDVNRLQVLWSRWDGHIEMGTEPLDVEALQAAADSNPLPRDGANRDARSPVPRAYEYRRCVYESRRSY